MTKKILFRVFAFLLFASLSLGAYVLVQLWTYEVFKTPVYESKPPSLPALRKATQVLVFSKTNSYRHLEAIPEVERFFKELGAEQDWDVFITENAAVHSPVILKKFDLIIWNNVTGDVLSPPQRDSLKTYIERGGRFLGLHGTGGNPEYQWQWIPEQLIKARFTAHPMFPQFRDADLHTENQQHPSTAHMPATKAWHEEWYSFEKSPRTAGVEVLVTVQENDYDVPEELAMGEDHPLVWHHTLGKGTVYYSALGHRAEAYHDEDYRKLLKGASLWLLEQ